VNNDKTIEAGAQALYYAYNAGGDPATAGLNFRGEPCPAWADLPDNVRAKWCAAFEGACEFITGVVEEETDDSNTTWHIRMPDPFDFVPSAPPGELSTFIINAGLAGLAWKFGDHSGDIFATLADGVLLQANHESEDDGPSVYVFFSTCEEGHSIWDNQGTTAADALAYLESYFDSEPGAREAHRVLSEAIAKVAAIRAKRAGVQP
jgi:hypothetical protein